jgi:uncharacterized membrane protein
MWDDWTGHGMNGWMWALMILGVVAVWTIVLVVVRAMIDDGSTGRAQDPPNHVESMRLLDERLAQGAITTQEYERTRDLLTGGR